MKTRIPPPLAADYPPVLLWLDDLEEMEGVLKAWASTVKFKTASAEYDSIAELKSDVKDDEILEFRIECSSPYASVELLRYAARVYVSASEDPANAGCVSLPRWKNERPHPKVSASVPESGLCFGPKLGPGWAQRGYWTAVGGMA